MTDLTPKQQAVANLLMDGKSNKEIARDLGVTYKTVRNTVQAILEKLGVHNRTAAAVKLYKMLHPRSWQPIETVPKDGTKIDIMQRNGHRVCNCEWNDQFGVILIHGYPAVTTIIDATHWMHIPQKPTVNGGA